MCYTPSTAPLLMFAFFSEGFSVELYPWGMKQVLHRLSWQTFEISLQCSKRLSFMSQLSTMHFLGH